MLSSWSKLFEKQFKEMNVFGRRLQSAAAPQMDSVSTALTCIGEDLAKTRECISTLANASAQTDRTVLGLGEEVRDLSGDVKTVFAAVQTINSNVNTLVNMLLQNGNDHSLQSRQRRIHAPQQSSSVSTDDSDLIVHWYCRRLFDTKWKGDALYQFNKCVRFIYCDAAVLLW